MKFVPFLIPITYLLIFSLFQHFDVPDLGYARLWTFTHLFFSVCITAIIWVPIIAYSEGFKAGKKDDRE